MECLEVGARRLGLAMTPQKMWKFRQYQEELLSWNQRVNLTAITNPSEIARFHFLDSLTVSLALTEASCTGGNICDVGSGAGFPGIPLKLMFPGMRLTLIDSTAKRTRFLNSLIETLGLKEVYVHTGRCEDLGHEGTLRESFDVVVSRAVASLSVMAELALPFCRLGGRIVLQKKGDIREELAQARFAFGQLGGRLVKVEPVPTEILDGQRVLTVVQKTVATPLMYPRRPGVPRKRPLKNS